MEIYKTVHYDKFTTLKGNRIIHREHLADLIKSIQKKNLLPFNPIIINEDNQIIDGQHRLEAAKHLQTPIYYVIAPETGEADVKMLNTNLRAWSITDFLHSYISMGYKDYETALEFANKFDLSISNAIAILTIKEDSGISGSPYRLFKNGDFAIENIKEAIEFADLLKSVSQYTSENTWKDRDFIRALRRVQLSGTSKDKLLGKLEKYPHQLYRRANQRDYIRQFEDVLNERLDY